MRAVSGGWHSPNLRTLEQKKREKQVNPALRLPAARWGQGINNILNIIKHENI
jgi:hypothetical protein